MPNLSVMLLTTLELQLKMSLNVFSATVYVKISKCRSVTIHGGRLTHSALCRALKQQPFKSSSRICCWQLLKTISAVVSAVITMYVIVSCHKFAVRLSVRQRCARCQPTSNSFAAVRRQSHTNGWLELREHGDSHGEIRTS